jgi:hypothetical protein
MMISALKTSGSFLAIPALLALVGWPHLAFGWVVALQFPPFLVLIVVSLISLLGAGLMRLMPFSFVSFGLLSSGMLLLLGLWSVPSTWAALPVFIGQSVLLTASALVPFAAIQFVLALFVSPRAPSSEEPT